jgi:hypothetical protein
MHRPTKGDSNKIYFAFFWCLCYFLWILEVYWTFNPFLKYIQRFNKINFMGWNSQPACSEWGRGLLTSPAGLHVARPGAAGWARPQGCAVLAAGPRGWQWGGVSMLGQAVAMVRPGCSAQWWRAWRKGEGRSRASPTGTAVSGCGGWLRTMGWRCGARPTQCQWSWAAALHPYGEWGAGSGSGPCSTGRKWRHRDD